MNDVIELTCTIDDMTGEALGYACELFRKEGANDVFMTAIQVKKNRPGFRLSVICDKDNEDKFKTLIFKHTSTCGLRVIVSSSCVMNHEIKEFESSFGKVRVKLFEGYGVKKYKFEYDDVAKIADEHKLSFEEVYQSLTKEYK